MRTACQGEGGRRGGGGYKPPLSPSIIMTPLTPPPPPLTPPLLYQYHSWSSARRLRLPLRSIDCQCASRKQRERGARMHKRSTPTPAARVCLIKYLALIELERALRHILWSLYIAIWCGVSGVRMRREGVGRLCSRECRDRVLKRHESPPSWTVAAIPQLTL